MKPRSLLALATLPPLLSVTTALAANWLTGWQTYCESSAGVLPRDICSLAYQTVAFLSVFGLLHLAVGLPLSLLLVPRTIMPITDSVTWRERVAIGLRFTNYMLFLYLLLEIGMQFFLGPSTSWVAWPGVLLFPFTAGLELTMVIREQALFDALAISE